MKTQPPQIDAGRAWGRLPWNIQRPRASPGPHPAWWPAFNAWTQVRRSSITPALVLGSLGGSGVAWNSVPSVTGLAG